MKIVIIGAGVIGLATAYYCVKKGHSVTIIERNPARRDGCSFGNAGMIVPSHFIPLAAPGMVALGLKWMWNPESPFYVKPRLNFGLFGWGFRFWMASTAEHVRQSAPLLRDLSFASRAAYEELAAQPGFDFGLVKRGLLMLCKTSKALEEEAHTARRAKELGIPAEVLDAKATAELDPGARMDIQGSVYFPQDCHLSPNLLMAQLQQQLEAAGTEIHWETEVLGWRKERGRIEAVETSKGEITGDEYLICGGSWSPVVVKDLGLKIPMQAGKGYSLTLPQPRQLPEICSILTEARVAVTPMGSSLRVGGTMELAGLNEDVSERRVKGIIKAMSQYYPEIKAADFDGIKPWVGLRPCSPDGLPYIGRTSFISNLSIATGHAMMGLSLAPVTGQLMASILSGEKPAINLDLLSPERFG